MAKTSIAVLCLLVAQAAAAFSGSDLRETIEAGRRVKDGHGRGADFQHSAFTTGFIAGVFVTLADIHPKACLPEEGNFGQYVVVTDHYLQSNPAQLHRPAQELVREAALQAFPCR